MQFPHRIIAADWSKNAAKRRMARAERMPAGRFRVYATEPVGDVATFFTRAKAGMPGAATVFMGFDFPIGLPHAYARQLGVASFREALPLFGRPPFTDFYDISDRPHLARPFYPPPARQKGLYSRQALADGLQVAHFDALMRQCDRTAQPPAGCLFFTLGGQQSGPGMVIGWRDLLAPALGQLRLWPFDGPLDALLTQPGILVSEVYPSEACRQMGLLPGRRWSKRRAEDRRAAAEGLLAHLKGNDGIELPAATRAQLQAGCATEDDFDAMVALLFMIEVVQGRRPCPVPEAPAIRAMEGWILGLALPAAGAAA